MKIPYEIDPDFGGVPQGEKYGIEDTPETESQWRKLNSDFAAMFKTFSTKEDYDFADWHYGMRALAVYTYTDRFFDYQFVPKIWCVIDQEWPCFARFECYSGAHKSPENRSGMIGSFMVFADRVIFDQRSVESGLVARLVE